MLIQNCHIKNPCPLAGVGFSYFYEKKIALFYRFKN